MSEHRRLEMRTLGLIYCQYTAPMSLTNIGEFFQMPIRPLRLAVVL